MELDSVGNVVAFRRFYVEGDPSKDVTVKLGHPQKFPDSPDAEDCFCPYQITGIGEERVRYAAGVDPFQAIELTFKIIGADLFRLNKQLGGKLRWGCDERGGLGFPVPSPTED